MGYQWVLIAVSLLACTCSEYQHAGTCVDKDGRLDCEILTCVEPESHACDDKKKCLTASELCNGVTDCEDGSDEKNCTVQSTVTTVVSAHQDSCKGFQCRNGKCISMLRKCDGWYDCTDDEDEKSCNNEDHKPKIKEHLQCKTNKTHFMCTDMSFCLSLSQICDGVEDCRDGLDEEHCASFAQECNILKCNDINAVCLPTSSKAKCECQEHYTYEYGSCHMENLCEVPKPHCSQICSFDNDEVNCSCEEGYVVHSAPTGVSCIAPDPAALLFYSTSTDVRVLNLRSNRIQIVAKRLKQPHGVTYDGQFVYWVETAEGHQAIMRTTLENIESDKQVIVSFGLEDVVDISYDHMGEQIYFSDMERGVITVCKKDGSYCATLDDWRHAKPVKPKYLTLDSKHSYMYWADFINGSPVIMESTMDGAYARVLVTLQHYATGLAVDAPSSRLYFVENNVVKGVMLDGKKDVFTLFEDMLHQPYSIAVFEDTVYISDWMMKSIEARHKITGVTQSTTPFVVANNTVYGIYVYHPILLNASSNPCQNHKCSHLCLVGTDGRHVCACPPGMSVVQDPYTCVDTDGYSKPEYLVVAGGRILTKFRLDMLGNPEINATHFDIGLVQAMAYNNIDDILYIYDVTRQAVGSVPLHEFGLGVLQTIIEDDFGNVVCMEYDATSNSLYIMDDGRRLMEVYSFETKKRASLIDFDHSIPIAFSLAADYGQMLVAVLEVAAGDLIKIYNYGMEGTGRKLVNTIRGKHIQMQYSSSVDGWYIADDNTRSIELMNLQGKNKERFAKTPSTVNRLAVTEPYIFWTDDHSYKLYWCNVHEAIPKTKRFDFSIFSNTSQLHIQSAIRLPQNDLKINSCIDKCNGVCVVEPHDYRQPAGHKCLCPVGFELHGSVCMERVCHNGILCIKSDICYNNSLKCDGKMDCPHGEDENGCTDSHIVHMDSEAPAPANVCLTGYHLCGNSSHCIPLSEPCEDHQHHEDCHECNTYNCTKDEFQCKSTGICIWDALRCDGEHYCSDGSDEEGCVYADCHNVCGHNMYCKRSHKSAVCQCLAGYENVTVGKLENCVDIDECANYVTPLCSQMCVNTYGSYECHCYAGYNLRQDKHTCQATNNSWSMVLVANDVVRSLDVGAKVRDIYSNSIIGPISDMDIHVWRGIMYLSARGNIIGVRITTSEYLKKDLIMNLGYVTKLAVDWITDNIYFALDVFKEAVIRVCNLNNKQCAVVQDVTSLSSAVVKPEITALAVDPYNRLLFYCLNNSTESRVYSSTLRGKDIRLLVKVSNCTGLVLNTFNRTIYITNADTPYILKADYEGTYIEPFIIENNPAITKPHNPVIFEDHIFFIAGNTIYYCQMYGEKTCEKYRQGITANIFKINNDAVQRGDVWNPCYNFPCYNVCVLDKDGPFCMCNDGDCEIFENFEEVEEIKPITVSATKPASVKEFSASFTFGMVLVVVFACTTGFLVLGKAYMHCYRRYYGKPQDYIQVHYRQDENLLEALRSDEQRRLSYSSLNGRKSSGESNLVNNLQFLFSSESGIVF